MSDESPSIKSMAVPPAASPLVEMLFTEVLEPPEGYEYFTHDGQLLWSVYNDDKWRLLLRNTKTKTVIPLFLNGAFVRSLAKALESTQTELTKAVESLIEVPEITSA